MYASSWNITDGYAKKKTREIYERELFRDKWHLAFFRCWETSNSFPLLLSIFSIRSNRFFSLGEPLGSEADRLRFLKISSI